MVSSPGNSTIYNGLVYKFEQGNFSELKEAKKWLIYKILDKFEGNKMQTSKHLGISYTGLLKLFKEFEDQRD